MSVQENIKLDEEMIAAINAHNIDRYVAHVGDDIITTNLSRPEPERGKTAVRQFLQGAFAAFSDYTIVIKNRTVTEDTIVTEINFGGTHDGPLHLGPDQALPATGRKISVEGIYVNTMRGGRVVESRQYPNMLGLMMQLGVIPAPEAA